MNLRNKLAGEIEDPVVAEALRSFKSSVDAWSEAAYSRPRTPMRAVRYSWRLAASWALGCVLAVGGLAGWMAERHHRQELTRIAAMRAAVQKAAQKHAAVQQPAAAIERTPAANRRSAAASATKEDEDLLATVDSDVSREVPAAMEPLAQLMNENGTE
jgi:predicted negative regulator of RcsB-dependent stress response